MSASLLGKKWHIKNDDKKKSLLEKLLHNRNLKTEEEIERFLNPSLERDLHDPFLMEDMERAVSRIKRAIEKKERVIIFGDYDIDGITGTAILVHTLRGLNANVSYRLPHRQKDGYGLRKKFMDEFATLNVNLVITVDNGISSKDEITHAKGLGIDVIITDHHSIPEHMPKDACAILHPKLPGTRYPFDELTGSAVAFKLAKALIKTFYPAEEHEQKILPLLDLAAMGTISDLGPLRGENRAIVKFGLEVLGNTRWPGLSMLKETAGIKGPISTHTVGFQIGPRINAAGRMDTPYYALQLLLDDGTKSRSLAEKLEQLNRERQKITELFFEEADIQAEQQIKNGKKIIIVHDKKWHTGIVGLLAGKLAQKYSVPCMVMEERGEIFIGSARSPSFFNVVTAITAGKKYLNNFGGHAQAAGFELRADRIEDFKKFLQNFAAEKLDAIDCAPTMTLECELFGDEITSQTTDILEHFKPFGMDNEVPRFLIQNVLPKSIELLGRDKKHLKFTAEMGNTSLPAICFNFGAFQEKLSPDTPIDIACEINEDSWNGRKRLQLIVVDIKV